MHPDNHTKDQIGEVIILEQYLQVLLPEVSTLVREHSPKTGREAAGLANWCMAVHQDPIKKKDVYSETEV